MLSGKLRSTFVISTSLLVALLVWSCLRWHHRRLAAYEAVDDLAECREIAADIGNARTSPKTALLAKQTDQQIALSIQLAAQVAEMSDSDIAHITPLHGRRLAKSDHIEQRVDVEIREITMGQLRRFLSEFDAMDCGLAPASIHLTIPRTPKDESETEVWNCELVLTYLVYSPE